ncbi:MAG: hypothetical protein ACYDBR_12860 [Gaiellaceae bacterium]
MAAIMLLTATAAIAASPRQIYGDLAAHGKLTKHYTAAELAAAAHDASIEGYGGVQVQTIQPIVQQTAGATHTVQRPTSGVKGATHSVGTLPFTGVQLSVFVALGLALLGGGLLLRRAGRSGWRT